MATTSERTQLVLYGTAACHLCEQALLLVQPFAARDCALREVDISESDELFERYGWVIPVLRRDDTGAELRWPFDAAAVAALLEAG